MLVGGGVVIARTSPGGGIRISATPTPTLLPGENLFYITTNPTWGSVSIDGHTIIHLPALGSTPLTLSIGGHTIVWNAPPLSPQQCLIDVPPQPTTGGNCTATDLVTVRSGNDSGLQATLITFTLTSSMLSNAQQTALDTAIQTLFTSQQATTTVQPSERYVDVNAPHAIATATQPVKATLSLHLDTNPASSRPCYATIIGDQPCTSASGGSCYALCTTTDVFNAVPQSSQTSYLPTWDVFAVVYATWTYTTLSGQRIAINQPDIPTTTGLEYLMSLSIIWTGSHWQVSDVPLSPLCTVTACVTVQSHDRSNPYSFLASTNQHEAVSWQAYTPGANLAAGCLAEAITHPGDTTPVPAHVPTAYILYRFGVLVAANALAHQYWPNLPVVTASEQGIVQKLLSK